MGYRVAIAERTEEIENLDFFFYRSFIENMIW